MEIFAFILKIILIILFLLYEIQQLISNIDSEWNAWPSMFNFQFIILYFGEGGHVE